MTKRTVVVTGGTGALGRAVVAKLLARDTDCHVTWKFARELGDFADRDRVTLHELDCGDEEQVASFFAGLARVDASIHLVGGFEMAPVAETGLEDFRRMFDLNVVTAFLCCREAIRRMRGQADGRIVNIAARPALDPTGGMIAYTTAKAAVASLSRCLAEEVREDGILVNAVVPSIIDTPANRAGMPDADFDAWPKADEVAEAIVYLAGPENTLTSGMLLSVFGRA